MSRSPPTIGRRHQMPFGAEVVSDGVRFRLWAPKHNRISLNIVGDQHLHLMRAAHDGWHELTTGEARPGSLYQFVLPDGMHVPDPASRFQPLDVHGPSEVIDPRPMYGVMRIGVAGLGKNASSTNCMSAHLPRRVPSEPQSPGLISCVTSESPLSS